MRRILVVDDDPALCRSLELQLRLLGYRVETSLNVGEGLEKTRTFMPDLLLLDINLPDGSGLKALPGFMKIMGGKPVIIITGETGNKMVVEAMHSGAWDYLKKPLDLEEITRVLDKVSDRSIQVEPSPAGPDVLDIHEFVGENSSIVDLHKQIGLLARSRVTVLIKGESGTGKELIARILHETSSPGQPFVDLNCSAVVPTLLESEFFGHEKGAFTGADRTKVGKLEYAGQGTVFLDEIGDMPRNLQTKLLRVLQEEEFVRVGGLEQIPFQARIIAATHHDLHDLIDKKLFREDLYYRLAVSTLSLPPLRERLEDIPHLVQHLLRKQAERHGLEIRSITCSALQQLQAYHWPGNVRELENVLTRAAALTKGTVIDSCDLQIGSGSAAGTEKESVDLSLAEVEKNYIRRVLQANGWNISRSAKSLAISPTTLRKKIKGYKLTTF